LRDPRKPAPKKAWISALFQQQCLQRRQQRIGIGVVVAGILRRPSNRRDVKRRDRPWSAPAQPAAVSREAGDLCLIQR
jgi:hypothetical protein